MVDSTLIAGTASFAVASPRILLLSSVSHCLRLSSSSSSSLKCRRCPPPSSPLPFVHKLGTFVNDVVEEKLAAAKCFGRKVIVFKNLNVLVFVIVKGVAFHWNKRLTTRRMKPVANVITNVKEIISNNLELHEGVKNKSQFGIRLFDLQQELSDNMKQKIRAEYEAITVSRRNTMALILSSYILSDLQSVDSAFAQPSIGFREYIDTFDGYSFKYPQNWIQVRGAGADIFFRDPFVLDENISVEFSSPSSSRYKSVEDLGPPQEAGKKVLKQYLTEFMSTRLGVRRESNILSTSSRIADDGKLYYQVEVNIKSYANNNELAVMPQDRVVRLEWDRRYLSVLGVENNRLYELRLQTPESVFLEEENDLRQVMDSFRVNKVSV